MNTIADMWETFNRTVVPAEASDTQRREMRRAFYGGAAGFLHLQLAIPEDTSEAAFSAFLEVWNDELEQFVLLVQAGGA